MILVPRLLMGLRVKKNWTRTVAGRSGGSAKNICFVDVGCLQMVTRQGTLNKTELVRGGKKQKKSWTPTFVVLTNRNLFLYKDINSAQEVGNSPSFVFLPALCSPAFNIFTLIPVGRL